MDTKLNERTVFLLDGTGALTSLILTGVILPHFSNVIGIPKEILYRLALLPAIYMIFSYSCYFLVQVIKGWMLITIMSANFLYCLVSGSLILLFRGLGDLGRYLLLAEIVIVLGVIALEYWVFNSFMQLQREDKREN